MKKGIIIVSECILLFALIVAVRVLIGILFPQAADSDAVRFVMAFISSMGCIAILRLNKRNNSSSDEG